MELANPVLIINKENGTKKLSEFSKTLISDLAQIEEVAASMPSKTEEKDKHLELLSDVIKSLILDEKILVSSSVLKQDLSFLSVISI